MKSNVFQIGLSRIKQSICIAIIAILASAVACGEQTIITTTPVDSAPLTTRAEKDFVERMKNNYGLSVELSVVLPGATSSIHGVQTLTESEIAEIEGAFKKTPYCAKLPANLYISKVPEGSNFFLGRGEYDYIKLNIPDGADVGELLKARGLTFGKSPLEKIIAHECGHVTDNKTNYANQTDYFNNRKLGDKDKNPIYLAFAELTGMWHLDSYGRYNRVEPDPRMPGNFSSAGMTEYFAELYSLFIVNPGLLTPREKRFFENLDAGLRRDGEDFLKEVAKNPEILLK